VGSGIATTATVPLAGDRRLHIVDSILFDLVQQRINLIVHLLNFRLCGESVVQLIDEAMQDIN
jgi:hypothetical protein